MIVQDQVTSKWFVWDTLQTQCATLTPLEDFLFGWYSEGVDHERQGYSRNSKLWHCELGKPLNTDKLNVSIKKYIGTPYNTRLWQAFSQHVFPLSLKLPLLDTQEEDNTENNTEMYCSQLIARTLIDCGALEHTKPCYAFLPNDFWVSSQLPWKSTYSPKKVHSRVIFPSQTLTRALFKSLYLQNIMP
jgi:hypothetical protein